MKKIKIADWDALPDRMPAHALVSNVDLVIVRYDDSARSTSISSTTC